VIFVKHHLRRCALLGIAFIGKVCTFVHTIFLGTYALKSSVLAGRLLEAHLSEGLGWQGVQGEPRVSPVPHEYRPTGDVGSTVPGVLARSCRIRLGLIRAAAASWRQEAPACRAAMSASW
jgi:hypothetical protein